MRHARDIARALFLGCLCITFCAGCPRGRAKAVEQQRGPKKDYRQMLERARHRKAAEQNLALLRQTVEKFQTDLGRLPTNLFELVRFNYMDELPNPPSGLTYRYDSRFAHVQYVPIPARPNAPEDEPGEPVSE